MGFFFVMLQSDFMVNFVMECGHIFVVRPKLSKSSCLYNPGVVMVG